MQSLGGSTIAGVLVAILAISGGAYALEYVEVTEEAGITFQHAGEVHADEQEWPAFPEIMGPGVCIADLDGDGYDDLYFVNARYNPQNPSTAGWMDDVDPTNELYRNDGDGTFTETTAHSGLDNRALGYGCSVADYDADGHVDVFVTNFGTNALYRNTGNGTFENVTLEAGVEGGDCGSHECMSSSSAWADYDGDGDLDLFVGNYVDTNLTDDQRGPLLHDGQENRLYRNEGDGTFTEVAEEAGVEGEATREGSKTLGVVWFDANRDGHPDLYVANDETENEYYVNDGDGTFTDRTHIANLADDRAGMGVAAQDYDRDGDADLFFTHYNSETNGFYENLADGTFLDRSGEDDQVESIQYVGWGTAFEDLDLDRDLDIVLGNGQTEWVSEKYGQPFQAYRQEANQATPSDPYWTNVTGEWGLLPIEHKVTRGLATGDLDLDGDVDVVAGNNANETAQLLEARDVSGNPLAVELVQPGPNPNAIGATITVTVDGQEMHRFVRTGSSYLSQHSLKATFGLGQATTADSLTVHWPDGATSSFSDVAGTPIVRVDRATESLVHDTIAPATTLAVDGTAGDNGWWVSPVDVGLEAEDRGVSTVSGVTDRQIALEDGDWQTFQEEIHFDEGVHAVHHRAVDAAGNMAPRSTTLVGVDTQPPTAEHSIEGTLGDEGWYVSENVSLLLDGEDANSGIARLEYDLGDGQGWQVYEEGGITLVDDGEHTVAYRAVDQAGLVGEEGTAVVRLDATPPDVSIEDPSPGDVFLVDERIANTMIGPCLVIVPASPDVPHDPFVVTGQAVDATSGTRHLVAQVGDQPLADEPETSEPYAWSWRVDEEPQGSHQLTVQARDVAGNVANASLPVQIVSATSASLDATLEHGPGTYVPDWIPGVPRPSELIGSAPTG